METKPMTTETETETKALHARIARLEREAAMRNGTIKAAPYVAPVDHTAQMRLPPSAIAKMADAVDDATLRAISADARRPVVKFDPPESRTGAVPSQNGWIEPAPLGPPPGVDLLDRLMDAEDRKDRADLERKSAERSAFQHAQAKLRDALHGKADADAKLMNLDQEGDLKC
jgi:hypothetical protein